MRRGPAAALLAGALLFSGCADETASTSATAELPAPTDPFGCGIVVTPETAVVGDTVLVSRAPAATGKICTTLAPGSVQTIELSSGFGHDTARESATAIVAGDGSFETTLTVPTDIRLGPAQVTVIPPAESDCTEAATAAGTPDDCQFPRAGFRVHFAPHTLTPLRIVGTDTELPDLTGSSEPADSYALAGPGAHQLTLVIFGSGCASRPTTYRDTAPAGRLEIVSETILPPGSDACTAQSKPWTTVIEVPDAYRDYRSVRVDNLDTVLLG